jgi:hypothetical protein
MVWVHGDWIDDQEGDGPSGQRWPFSPYVREVFERAGWKPLPPPAPVPNGDAHEYAKSLLEEFGGLTVGETGQGIEAAASDIEFATEPEDAERYNRLVQRWPSLHGAVAIGLAHNTHVRVFVTPSGEFLAVTVPDERLYNFGIGFAQFAEALLRGLAWPRPDPSM